MRSVVAAIVAISAAGPASAETKIFEPRAVLPLIVVLPAGESIHATVSSVTRTVDNQIRRASYLTVRAENAGTIRGCRGEPDCIAHRIDAPRLLLISVAAADDTTDRISAVWMDLAERRVVHRTRIATLTSGTDLDDWVAKLVVVELAGPLSTHQRTKIDAAVDPIGSALTLDGRPLGTAAEATVTIVGVPVGPHELIVTHDDHEPHHERIVATLEANQQVRVELVNRDIISPKLVTIYGSVGVGVVGLALTVWGLVYSSTREKDGFSCLLEDCRHSRFPSFERMLSGSEEGRDDGVILTIPLGYALLGAGATTALTTYAFADADEWPWWPIVVGLAVGVVAYGASALLAPR